MIWGIVALAGLAAGLVVWALTERHRHLKALALVDELKLLSCRILAEYKVKGLSDDEAREKLEHLLGNWSSTKPGPDPGYH